MHLDRVLSLAFHNMQEGVIIVDKEGMIQFVNTAYLRFLKMKEEDVLGRPLLELRPDARLLEVLRTGKALLHAPRKHIGDADVYFTNMYPLRQGEETLGGVAIITFMDKSKYIRAELDAKADYDRQLMHCLSSSVCANGTFPRIVAVSELSKQIKSLAERIAPTDATVLLECAHGTGKHLYAQAIHNASQRKDSVFLALNCAEYTANTLDAALFGYVEGAFSGARKGGKVGAFETAEGGTLFLDRVDAVDISLQAKLLRVLQEKRIRPVGGVDEIPVDVRIICATHRSLSRAVEEGRFRKDLFYRLNTFPIHIPLLKERREDIPALTHMLLQEIAAASERRVSITPEAIDCLTDYDWPGNVAELKNVLELSAYLCDDGVITKEILPESLRRREETDLSMTLPARVKLFERNEITKLLDKNGSDLIGKKKTAQELGISLASLYNKL